MSKGTLSVDKKWIELLDLEGLHSEASKINQSLKSIVIDLNKLVNDSSFYQEQRSQYLAFLDF